MKNGTLITLLSPLLPNYQMTEIPAAEEECINNIAGCFDSFKSYSMVVLSSLIGLFNHGKKSWLALLSITQTTKGIRIPQHQSQLTEYELIGLAILNRDYGKVFIRPETLADKISELFDQAEIDFESEPEFSSKYYLLADNEERLRKTISPHFLRTISKYDDLEIEIQGKALVVRLRKVFTPEIGKQIAEFVGEINDGEN